MRLFITILRRIFNKKQQEINKRKDIIDQLKRIQRRDKQERDSI